MPIKKEEIVKAYTTLIATVGASLYANLNKLIDCKAEFENNTLEPIVQRMVSRSWGDPEEAMTYGSEINSTVSLIRRFENLGEGTFNPINLYFFVSDTLLGEKIGILLKSFFERDPELRFKNVKVIKIDKLSDTDEYAFGKEGLRNLVREFARVARNHRFGLAVNATGGYKAQIAFALALGQAMKFPVFYRFERFDHIIKMPPLPVALDWEIYLTYHRLLDNLEDSAQFSEKKDLPQYGFKNYAEMPEELKTFLEREKIETEYYLGLSPMGQVFIESARERLTVETKLPESEKSPSEKAKYIQDESHALNFAKKHNLYEKISALPFVGKVVGFQYSQNFELNGCKARMEGDEILLEYGNKGGTHRFKVYTTARNPRERLAALERLKEAAKEW